MRIRAKSTRTMIANKERMEIKTPAQPFPAENASGRCLDIRKVFWSKTRVE